MSGMFWHNNYSPSIKISLMLHEKEITLKKLMDDDNILQECRAQNKKLLKFLTRLDILEELVNLIIEEPSQDIEERWRYKYSNIACELLTCEVSVLTEKLAGNEMLMFKLYSFIDKEQPLNPLLASFFSKTLHTLLRRTSYQNWFSYQFACLQVLESFKSHKNWIDLLLQHIETSAIMDLILVLVTKIESPEISQNISNWLDDQQLIQRLIKLLSPTSDSEKHTNVSQLLSDIVKSSRLESENRSYSIYQTIQSEEIIQLILNTVLSEEKIESSIVGGVRILISLLGQRESSESYRVPFSNIVEDEKRDKFAMIIIPYLNKFNLLLLNPPEKPSIKTTAGTLEKPFGPCRLHILKLFVSLLSTKNSKVLEKFAEFNTFKILLDLFFQFAWNNFLHTQVQQCLSLAINCNCSETNEIIYSHVFVKSKLIDRILEAWNNNDHNALNQLTGVRQGYMGHLIILANDIVTRCEENNVLVNYLKTNLFEETIKKWEYFVSFKLDEINKKQELILGESSEGYGSSDGNPSECTPFQDLYDVETNTDYQERSTLPVYVDEDYSFQIEKFNDGDNTFQNSMDQFNLQSFNFTPDEFEKKQELFNKICNEKKFEDISSSIQWEQGDFSIDKVDLLSKRKQSNSSSSDEEDEDNPCDLSWIDIKKPLSKPDKIPIKVWYTETPKPVEETGWATFDDFGGAYSIDVNSSNNSCNKTASELLEVSTINETILLDTKTGSDSNYTENKCYINKKGDTESEAQKTNLDSVSNSDYIDSLCSETSANIPDSNANVTIFEKRMSESNNVCNHLEESPLNISDTSENLTIFQTATSATDNVSSITSAVFES